MVCHCLALINTISPGIWSCWQIANHWYRGWQHRVLSTDDINDKITCLSSANKQMECVSYQFLFQITNWSALMVESNKTKLYVLWRNLFSANCSKQSIKELQLVLSHWEQKQRSQSQLASNSMMHSHGKSHYNRLKSQTTNHAVLWTTTKKKT